ncbi:hypothetical protein TNCV_4406901 [Trichonephila clavipes]|nr:hypothetical protein TNCV_4406901 [Trichonephila clavipes]
MQHCRAYLICQKVYVSHDCLFTFEESQGSTITMPAEHAPYHDTPTRPLHIAIKILNNTLRNDRQVLSDAKVEPYSLPNERAVVRCNPRHSQ